MITPISNIQYVFPTSTSMLVSWSHYDSEGDDPAEGYYVAISDVNMTEIIGPEIKSYRFLNVNPGVIYRVGIAAFATVDGINTISNYTYVNITVPSNTGIIVAPTGVMASYINYENVYVGIVTWINNSNNEIGYKVFIFDLSNSTSALVASAGPNIQGCRFLYNFIQGHQYNFKVMAYNNTTSSYSAVSNSIIPYYSYDSSGGVLSGEVNVQKDYQKIDVVVPGGYYVSKIRVWRTYHGSIPHVSLKITNSSMFVLKTFTFGWEPSDIAANVTEFISSQAIYIPPNSHIIIEAYAGYSSDNYIAINKVRSNQEVLKYTTFSGQIGTSADTIKMQLVPSVVGHTYDPIDDGYPIYLQGYNCFTDYKDTSTLLITDPTENDSYDLDLITHKGITMPFYDSTNCIIINDNPYSSFRSLENHTVNFNIPTIVDRQYLYAVEGRAFENTEALDFPIGATVELYDGNFELTDSGTLIDLYDIEYYSSEKDLSVADIAKELCGKAGVNVIARKDFIIQENESTLNTSHWFNLSRHKRNFIAKFERDWDGYEVGIGGLLLLGDDNFTITNRKMVYLGLDNSNVFFKIWNGSRFFIIENYPLDFIPCGIVTISLYEDTFSIWIEDRFVISFHIKDTMFTASDLNDYAFAFYKTDNDTYISPSVDEINDRKDTYILDMGSSGTQLLSDMIGQRIAYFKDDSSGGIEIYKSHEVVTDEIKDYSDISEIETDAVSATRIRMEGIDINEIYDDFMMREYGNIFSLQNSQETNFKYELVQYAEDYLREVGGRIKQIEFNGAAYPQVEANDIINVNDHDTIVDSVTFDISSSEKTANFEMKVRGRWSREALEQ